MVSKHPLLVFVYLFMNPTYVFMSVCVCACFHLVIEKSGMFQCVAELPRTVSLQLHYQQTVCVCLLSSVCSSVRGRSVGRLVNSHTTSHLTITNHSGS